MCPLTTIYLHLTIMHLGATFSRLNALALESEATICREDFEAQ